MREVILCLIAALPLWPVGPLARWPGGRYGPGAR